MYRISSTMVAQMAIYQSIGNLPPLTAADLESIPHEDSSLLEIMQAFDRLVSRNHRFESAENFNREVAKVIPIPYHLQLDFFPVCDHWVRSSGEREYHVVSQLIEVCQEMAPSMAAHGPLFWQQLERLAVLEDLMPLYEAYQQLCDFFQKGVPFDRLFEYYKLVSKISSSLKSFGDFHGNTHSSISMPRSQATNKDGMVLTEQFEFETPVLKHKANLLMNYAEELHQARSLGLTPEFHPNIRAEKEQIERIDILSANDGIKLSDVVDQLGSDVFRTSLPGVIKHKLSQFAQFIKDEMQELTASTNPASKSAKMREILKEWDPHLSAALKEGVKINESLPEQLIYAVKRFKLSQKPTYEEKLEEYNRLVRLAIIKCENYHIYPSTIFRLHETPIVWQAMLRTTEREFATVDKLNAEILIERLSRTQRIVTNIPLFDRIYYALDEVNASERNTILQSVEERIKKWKTPTEEFKRAMKSEEYETLTRIFTQIRRSWKTKARYEDWRRKLNPTLPSFPSDLVKIIADMFGDSSRQFLMKKLDSRWHHFLDWNVKPYLRRALLYQELRSLTDGGEFLADIFLRLIQEESASQMQIKSRTYGMLYTE
ncbi:hypothetical protein PtA15_5A525 [Puccinia triticina]|uniref:Uncharacterized protein n=1 Tax=Puccinia triticina TaxID=208348 RepID=A0ABY7CKE4_9BASI|nr:uncharacterized protein PtA15_5A525 [Puccinia triticina]WAQ84952.1 hypothetical protein PtA15_5A525 [Puccinia triticina]WAR58287.1 hypothetical protein PtB15_5B521 [Puccinia triticina]